MESFGVENCIENGHKPRTFHEVNSGLSNVRKRGIEIDAVIVNLPYTVLNARRKPAETAFTTRDIEQRKIYLVPDHTPTRILNDKAYHIDGFELLLSQKDISHSEFGIFTQKLETLDIGKRVSASIIHEYGHILTYRALDTLKIHSPNAAYKWLDEVGY